MEMYQTPQMEEEIRRLREISNENQKKVNNGIFVQEKTEQIYEKEEEETGSGIFRGIFFLLLAAILLGQAGKNDAVTQVMAQIGKTIQNISQKAEDEKWFSFGDQKREGEPNNE